MEGSSPADEVKPVPVGKSPVPDEISPVPDEEGRPVPILPSGIVPVSKETVG